MDTDPYLRRSGREGAGADLIAHTGGGRSGQGWRRAAWRHQCAVHSQTRTGDPCFGSPQTGFPPVAPEYPGHAPTAVTTKAKLAGLWREKVAQTDPSGEKPHITSSLIARVDTRAVWWGMNALLPAACGYLLCSFAFITAAT